MTADSRPRRPVAPAAVLWDMDGTIVDTEPYWIATEYELAAEFGGEWSDAKAHSIVGLDLYTGQLKWYFQQVHHDMWDSDLPNNGVMFDGTFNVDGKMVKKHAVSYVNKVGMTFATLFLSTATLNGSTDRTREVAEKPSSSA